MIAKLSHETTRCTSTTTKSCTHRRLNNCSRNAHEFKGKSATKGKKFTNLLRLLCLFVAKYLCIRMEGRMYRTVRLLFLGALALLMPIAAGHAQAQERKPLAIYYSDTEGGKAALYVSPT